MHQELADFLNYCRIERRLAPPTCSAYERDVGACLAFVERQGIVTVGEVRPADLRRFLVEESIAVAVEPGAYRRRAQVLLPLPARERADQRYTRVTAHELRGAVKRLQFAHSGGRTSTAVRVS